MSIPIGSAFSETESVSENVKQSANKRETFSTPEGFCEEIAPQAKRYAMSILRVWADAEEVVQEAFCRLIQSNQLEDCFEREPEIGFKPLLFTAVRNLAIDQLRKKKRRRFEPLDLSQIASSKVPADGSKLQQLEYAVQSILKDLPSQWSEALQLKINGGLSYDDIANVLGATKAQVRTWIFRARKQMDRELCQQGFLDRGTA